MLLIKTVAALLFMRGDAFQERVVLYGPYPYGRNGSGDEKD